MPTSTSSSWEKSAKPVSIVALVRNANFSVNASLMCGIHCLPTPWILHRYSLAKFRRSVIKVNLSSFIKRF